MTDDRAALVAMVLVALVLVPVLPLNRRIAQETASGILIAAIGALEANFNGAGAA